MTARRLAVGLVGVLTYILGLGGPADTASQELLASVAISLKEPVEALGRAFVARHPGVTFRYNFGASGELQKQIEAGAPVDLFVSAGERQMDELERRALVVPASRRLVARNVLTVVLPIDSRLDLTRPGDLLDRRVARIAIGNPRTVPAGQYAEESLRALGLWNRLRAKLVFAENVRQTLDYVARGEVDAGIVYVTDASARGSRVREAFRPGEETYRPVVYPAAVVVGSRHAALAGAFLDLLASPEGQAVLARHGFRPAPAGGR